MNGYLYLQKLIGVGVQSKRPGSAAGPVFTPGSRSVHSSFHPYVVSKLGHGVVAKNIDVTAPNVVSGRVQRVPT